MNLTSTNLEKKLRFKVFGKYMWARDAILTW